MASLNQFTFIGWCVKEPEVRFTTSGKQVANFSVAVDNRYKKDEEGKKTADFFPITAWEKKAELIGQYVEKGMLIYCQGRIQPGSYTDKDGNKRYKTEYILENFQFLSSSKNRGESKAAPANRQEEEDEGPVVEDLSELPF